MEKRIKEILDEKLIGNDSSISNIILSYLEKKCFICYNSYLENSLKKSYCDTRPHTQLYMDVCQICIDKFDFKRCYQCHIYVDRSKAYTVGTLDNHCCQYCVAREDSYGISSYSGWL